MITHKLSQSPKSENHQTLSYSAGGSIDYIHITNVTMLDGLCMPVWHSVHQL